MQIVGVQYVFPLYAITNTRVKPEFRAAVRMAETEIGLPYVICGRIIARL